MINAEWTEKNIEGLTKELESWKQKLRDAEVSVLKLTGALELLGAIHQIVAPPSAVTQGIVNEDNKPTGEAEAV